MDLVCVVDTSGSMQSETYARDQNNKLESTGLSVLDVVKHALNTIVTGLSPDDTIGIIKFDSSAVTVCSSTKCTTTGKAAIKNAIQNLRVGGATNLWGGLEQGMKMFTRNSDVSNTVCQISRGANELNLYRLRFRD
ncbi:MAG: VWA domain-containing protein [Sphingobacteriaceae bacterium]|nr:MAG: VWA domain-containing protein [Sphingobacteriaceae bacterium]